MKKVEYYFFLGIIYGDRKVLNLLTSINGKSETSYGQRCVKLMLS